MSKDDSMGIRCDNCGSYNTEVIDSRPATNYTQRRRRVCNDCDERTTAYEISGKELDDYDLLLRHANKVISIAEKIKEIRS